MTKNLPNSLRAGVFFGHGFVLDRAFLFTIEREMLSARDDTGASLARLGVILPATCGVQWPGRSINDR